MSISHLVWAVASLQQKCLFSYNWVEAETKQQHHLWRVLACFRHYPFSVARMHLLLQVDRYLLLTAPWLRDSNWVGAETNQQHHLWRVLAGFGPYPLPVARIHLLLQLDRYLLLTAPCLRDSSVFLALSSSSVLLGMIQFLYSYPCKSDVS